MVKSHAPLQIRLTEPVVFLRGPSTGADFRGRPQTARDGQPAMLRGLLTLRLSKPTRIRNIGITLEGKSRTEWPEGIGPRRNDTFEEHDIISESSTFFCASDAAAAKVARRSQSLGPGGLAQYDLDSDDDDACGVDDAAFDLPPTRGRPLGRSSSVLPSNPEDWMSWHRDGYSRQVSPERLPASDQASGASFSNLAVDQRPERGPSPAYTPTGSGSGTGRHTPLRDVTSNGSERVGRDVDGRSRPGSMVAPTDPNEGDEEWEPHTPTGSPEEIPLPAVTDPGPPTSTAIRFQSPERSAAAAEPLLPTAPVSASPSILATTTVRAPLGAPLMSLPSRAETIDSLESSSSSRSHTEYHPVMANQRTAVNTPINMTPPTMSPRTASPIMPSRQGSYHDEVERPASTRRRSSGLRPSQTQPGSSAGVSTSPRNSIDLDRPDRRGRAPGALILNGRESTSGSEPPSSTQSVFSGPDEYRERKSHQHHKFSLTAAIRSLSQDVRGRVRSSSSKPPSRAASRTSSRTRGNDTPRTPFFHINDGPISQSVPMTRNGSASHLPTRAAVDDSFVGRDRRSRSRNQSPAGHDDSRGRSLHRRFGGKEEDEEIHNWKEFRKGIYNYPIAFPIPLNAPPSMHAEFGSVVYRLKATVVRVGALTPNLVEELEIAMVAGPQEDDMEETDNIIVERQWEDQMRYQIALSGKAFPIGSVIPMSIRLMPLAKCKIYRLTVALEEKTDYYAVGRKVARHETPRRFILFQAKNTELNKKERPEPLLPILSDAEDALKDSPLAELAHTAAVNNPREFADFFNPEDDVYASLLDPLGPWHLEKDLSVPDCHTRIKFSTKHEQTNISVGHCLKVTIRVERGDDAAIDSKGRRKQFDIIIETPIKILDCRVNPQINSLPSYERMGGDTAPPPSCSIHAKTGGSEVLPKTMLIGTSAAAVHAASNAAHAVFDAALTPFSGHNHILPLLGHSNSHVHQHPATHNSHGHGHEQLPNVPEGDDTLLERNIVYDRLISGQETETGEFPPTYGEAVANAIRSARSASRAASRSHVRSTTRTTSTPGSRAASRAPTRSNSRARLSIDE